VYTTNRIPVDNPREIVNNIKSNSKVRSYYTAQINVVDKNLFKEFTKFCNNLAKKQIIDELGGVPEGESKREFIRRYSVNIPFEVAVENAETGIACGIKIVPNPTIKMNDYENWDGGYIESFIRMDGNESYTDWFIWQYIEMKHLETILSKFKDDLIILKI
jgi:hypothetical protein